MHQREMVMERNCAILLVGYILTISVLLGTTQAIDPSWTKEAEQEGHEGTWTPTVMYLGDLPIEADINGSVTSYPVSISGSRRPPKQLLLYSFITIHDDGEFQRGYYRIYTVRKSDGAQFSFYMNMAKVEDTITGSQNFWLPFGRAFEPNVYAELIAVTGMTLKSKRQVKSFAGLEGAQVMHAYVEEEEMVGQILITGFEM